MTSYYYHKDLIKHFCAYDIEKHH